jgi:hypothetical protein
MKKFFNIFLNIFGFVSDFKRIFWIFCMNIVLPPKTAQHFGGQNCQFSMVEQKLPKQIRIKYKQIPKIPKTNLHS